MSRGTLWTMTSGVAVEFEGDEDADEESEVDEVEVCCSCDVCTMTLLNT